MAASLLAGCGSGSTSSSSSAVSTSTTASSGETAVSSSATASGGDYDVENREYNDVEITFLNRMDDSNAAGQWYQQCIEDFEAKYPGITVNSVSIPTEADYLDQESISMSDPSSMPNIFEEYGGSRVLDYIEAGNLLDLTPYFDYYSDWKDSFKDTAWTQTDFSSYGIEGTYGVPFSMYFISLYYNEDILSENNIDPASIKSWDDLMDACATLKENGVQPFEMGEKDNYRFGHLHTVLNYKTYGCEVADKLGNDELSYDSEEEKAIYQMIIDATDKGYLGTNLLGTDDGQEQELFNTGQTAFLFMGSWYPASLQSGDYELYNNQKIHALAFPYVDEQYAHNDMGGGNNCYYITDTGDPDENAAAVLFMKYMTSEEQINKYLEGYSDLTAVNPTTEMNNYLLAEVEDLMKESEVMYGDIENYDTQQHMINTVRNALQGIPNGDTADDVGKNIVETSKEYEG